MFVGWMSKESGGTELPLRSQVMCSTDTMDPCGIFFLGITIYFLGITQNPGI
jgi:hypothetical protein